LIYATGGNQPAATQSFCDAGRPASGARPCHVFLLKFHELADRFSTSARQQLHHFFLELFDHLAKMTRLSLLPIYPADGLASLTLPP